MGLNTINRLVEEGYRVIVKPKVLLKYLDEFYRDENGNYSEGACSHIVFPDRRGEVHYAEVNDYIDYIDIMTWFEKDSYEEDFSPLSEECINKKGIELLDNLLVEEIITEE